MSENAQVTEQQKLLLMDKLVGERMESIIPQMQGLACSYNLQNVSEKSPFRNVLNVSTELGSDVEVTKNFIRYQLGRSGSNRMWSTPVVEGKSFAVALVSKIENLSTDADGIVEQMEIRLGIGLDSSWKQKVHRKLMQLYLGYLARHQVYLAKSKGGH